MVSYARATRGRRLPSLDTHSGRASSLPSRLKRRIGRRWLLDARREGLSGDSPQDLEVASRELEIPPRTQPMVWNPRFVTDQL